MKRLMISAFAAVAVLAVAATMLRSHSLSTAPTIKTAAQETSPTDAKASARCYSVSSPPRQDRRCRPVPADPIAAEA